MNHDYEHCLAYTSDCPIQCFRGALVRDLDRRPHPLPVSWIHFRGTDECMQKGGKKAENE